MAWSRKKKIFAGISGFFLLILLIIIVLPLVLLSRVEGMVKEEMNKNLDATADFNDADLTIISSFPDFTLSVKDFSIVGKGDFKGDTLLSVVDFSVKMDFWTVVKGEEFEIQSMKIDRPYVNVIKNKYGVMNTDIAKETSEKEESSFSLRMEEFIISNGRLAYTDYSGNPQNPDRLLIKGINQNATTAYSAELAEYKSEVIIDQILYNEYPPYHIEFITDAYYHTDSSLIRLRENRLSINELDLAWDGWARFLDEEQLEMDFVISSGTETFKDILSLLPSAQLQQLEGVEANGEINVGGFARGVYGPETFPNFDLGLDIISASLKYPDLPNTITNINVNAHVSNPGGSPGLTKIEIPQMHMEFGSNPLDLTASLSNFMDNPLSTAFDLHAKGSIVLEEIGYYVPVNDLSMKGRIDLQADASGVAKDLVFGDYDKMGIQAGLQAENLDFFYTPIAERVLIPEADLVVNPMMAKVNMLSAKIGSSDFKLTGTAENLLTYYMGLKPLGGIFNLNSEQINADELILISERFDNEEAADGTEANTAMMAEEPAFVEVPPMLDLVLNAQVGKVIFDGMELKNVSTEIGVADEALELNNMRADLLGGSWIIDGKYITKDMVDKPRFEFSYDIEKFDIAESFDYFNSMDKLAPVAGHMLGVFSSDLSLNGNLNEDLSLDVMSLNGDGRVDVPFATFESLPLLEKAADLTQLVDLENLAINDAWTVLSFNDGRVYIDPTSIAFKDMNLHLQGSNGFDYSMDYLMRIDVPTTKLGQAKSVAEGLLAKNPIPNFNLSMPEIVSFNIEVGGTFTKPELKLLPMTLGDDQSIKDQLKQNLKDQLDATKDTVIADAKDLGNDAKGQLQDVGKETVNDILKGGTDSLDLGNDLKGVGDSLKKKMFNKGIGGFKWPKK